jgi:hypothetical protein
MSRDHLDVHQLRKRWKPQKERLLAKRSDHPTPIRFHRACSWLARVEQMDESDVDLALIAQWIALNSLYGQWDLEKSSAVADRECWRVFLDRIVDLDADGVLPAMLVEHRGLVMMLCEDPYLNDLFWKDPRAERAPQLRRKKFSAQSWYFENNWKLILEAVADRIYLMRCQLIHGAATFGGSLNRRSLKHCALMMSQVISAVLLVLIDHGAEEDWGIMCYPPVQPGTRPVTGDRKTVRAGS